MVYRRDTSKSRTLTSSGNVSTCTPGQATSGPWTSWRWSWEVSACPPLSPSSRPTWRTRGVRSPSQTSWTSCTATPRRNPSPWSYSRLLEEWIHRREGLFRRKICGTFWSSGGRSWAPEKVRQRNVFCIWDTAHMCTPYIFMCQHSLRKNLNFEAFERQKINLLIQLFSVDQIFREANIKPNGMVNYEEFVKIVCAPVPDYYWSVINFSIFYWHSTV